MTLRQVMYRDRQKRRCCLLSYSQAEPGRVLTQPSLRLLAEPCTMITTGGYWNQKLLPSLHIWGLMDFQVKILDERVASAHFTSLLHVAGMTSDTSWEKKIIVKQANIQHNMDFVGLSLPRSTCSRQRKYLGGIRLHSSFVGSYELALEPHQPRPGTGGGGTVRSPYYHIRAGAWIPTQGSPHAEMNKWIKSSV